jgi:hypothetical protein
MKRLTLILLAAGLSVFGSQSLSAQDQQEIANIPFAFHANQRTFPAGTYRVAAKNQTGLFQLFGPSGHSIFMSASRQKAGKPDNPRLTFARYGDDYLLSEIWLPGSTVGYTMSESALKQELTRKIGVVSMISVRLASR